MIAKLDRDDSQVSIKT